MKQRVIDATQVALGNLDLSQRILKEGITFSYHEETDVLTVTTGTPEEAITEPLLDNMFYRVHPETLKIVGLEIIEFKRDFLPHNRAAQEYFQAVYGGEVSGERIFTEAEQVPGLREFLAIAGIRVLKAQGL